jgi:hypothetical protein
MEKFPEKREELRFVVDLFAQLLWQLEETRKFLLRCINFNLARAQEERQQQQ